MLTNTTITKLNEMRLSAMAESLREQMKNPSYASLSFEERFRLVVDAEWARRKSNQLSRLIKKATLRYPNACVEDIEYHTDRRLEQSQILRLATGNYIHENLNVILMEHQVQVKLSSAARLETAPAVISIQLSTFAYQSY